MDEHDPANEPTDGALRDDFGRQIEGAFGHATSAALPSRQPLERVRRRAVTRQRTRTVVASAAALAIVVATVAITRSSDSPRVKISTPVGPSARCSKEAPPNSDRHVTWAPIVRWKGVTYSLSRPALFGTLGSRVGAVCYRVDATTTPNFQFRDGDSTLLPARTPLYDVVGYRHGRALAARVDGVVRVLLAEGGAPVKTGADVYDLGNSIDGGIARIDVGDGGFAKRIITDRIAIRGFVKVLRGSPAHSRSFTHTVGEGVDPPLVLTLHRNDGAVIELNFDTGSGATDLVRLTPAETALVSKWFHEAADHVPGAQSAGIAVVHGPETYLYDDDGHQVSVLANATLPLNYIGALLVGTAPDGGPSLRPQGAPTNRPPGLAADCQQWSTSRQYRAAVCGPTQLPDRVDVVGPNGTSSYPFAKLQRGGGHLVEVFVRDDGWAAVQTSGECEVPGTVYLNTTSGQSRPLPNSPESGVLGVRLDGRFLAVLPEGICGSGTTPTGIYAIDPSTLDHQLVLRTSLNQAAYRWSWAVPK